MEKRYIEMLEKIGTMTVNLNIAYSVITHKFYLNTDLNRIKGENIITVGTHEDTPEEAIESAYNELVNANEGIYYVNKNTRREKEFKWNGQKFVKTLERKVPEDIIIED